MNLPLLVGAAVVLGIVAAVGIFASKIYNQLVAMKNRCDNGFSQIDVQLKRRYDLIPNLVECVKSYMGHERETLEKVIAARNQASQGLAKAAQDPTNASAVSALMGAEGALTGALGKLSFVMENYPELKANETVAGLMEELTSTENRVSFARQAYNDWVTSFNTYRQSFPTIMFAPTFGFHEDRPLLEIPNVEEIQEAPQVVLT
ncbi:MAG: LemA family protein [Pirellulaceae bacterium]|nr:LemA family protein [Planctomycetales bacterium]